MSQKESIAPPLSLNQVDLPDDDEHKTTADTGDKPQAASGISVRVSLPLKQEEVGEQARGGKEIGGRDGPDPTRYGDWEMNGRCIDF